MVGFFFHGDHCPVLPVFEINTSNICLIFENYLHYIFCLDFSLFKVGRVNPICYFILAQSGNFLEIDDKQVKYKQIK